MTSVHVEDTGPMCEQCGTGCVDASVRWYMRHANESPSVTFDEYGGSVM
jgi:hypothetical protein